VKDVKRDYSKNTDNLQSSCKFAMYYPFKPLEKEYLEIDIGTAEARYIHGRSDADERTMQREQFQFPVLLSDLPKEHDLHGKQLLGVTWHYALPDGKTSAFTSYYYLSSETFVVVASKKQEGQISIIEKDKRFAIYCSLSAGEKWERNIELSGGKVQKMEFTVENSDETVDVPFGTFEHCLRVKQVQFWESRQAKTISWYAKGIGLVKRAFYQVISSKEHLDKVSVLVKVTE
jgi:hypothetical protein